MAVLKDFQNGTKSNWCPGCGHYAVLNAIQNALVKSGTEPHEAMVVGGIGCSSRIYSYLYAYGFHSLHGRALPIAQGIKMANKNLKVIAAGGDGDGFAIGTAHTIHSMRRNIDMTYVVMDNHVYGLTKGQASPRSDLGFQTVTSPEGTIENPISAIGLALASGATFIAQTTARDIQGAAELIRHGMEHKGFAFINIFSPCVTYNPKNTYDWFAEHIKPLAEIEGYDPSNKMHALDALEKYDGLMTGVIYQDTTQKDYQAKLTHSLATPLTELSLELDKDVFETWKKSYM